MPTIPQRVASAFAVLCGQYGDVTQMARDRERSRQSVDREAEQVADAVDGAAAQARIDELQQQLAQRQAEVQALQDRLKRAVEITPDKQDEFAAVAQAEGVSLSAARRLLRVVEGSEPTTPLNMQMFYCDPPDLEDIICFGECLGGERLLAL